jgi:hypothetical protein
VYKITGNYYLNLTLQEKLLNLCDIPIAEKIWLKEDINIFDKDWEYTMMEKVIYNSLSKTLRLLLKLNGLLLHVTINELYIIDSNYKFYKINDLLEMFPFEVMEEFMKTLSKTCEFDCTGFLFKKEENYLKALKEINEVYAFLKE